MQQILTNANTPRLQDWDSKCVPSEWKSDGLFS